MGVSSPTELDLRGLKCPMPVLLTRKALRKASVGDMLVVLCTDPLAAIDIPHFAREEGHRLARQTHADGLLTFVLIKQRG